MPSLFYTLITVFIETHFQLKKNVCLMLEMCLIILPEILGMTLLSEYPGMILYTMLLISMFLLTWFYHKTMKLRKNIVFDSKFITNSRSTINVLAVIAILAVDFDAFPSRFAKTESLGYSLMDTGVGLYVFANGIVSPESRGVRNPITRSIKGSLALLIIGIGRFILLRIFHYHVPASEYGVHWNFFITLGVTKVFTSFFLNVFNVKHIYMNAVMLLMAHEMLLESGLKQFVFEDSPRDNFFKANKEGIVSSLGFVVLYLFSVYFGYILNIKDKNQSVFKVFRKHLIAVCLSLCFSVVFQHCFGISRRLANGAYIGWILFLGIFCQTIFYLVQVCQKAFFRTDIVQVPYINEAVNYNGLVFFLVANVLTGVVNLVINTREYSDFQAFTIVVGYMTINILVVSYLYAKGIQLKF